MRNKGITLIALIITIIVMLILVAVVINVSLSGELFNKAKEATYSYEVERKKENLADYEVEYYLKTGLILGDTIKEAIAKSQIRKSTARSKKRWQFWSEVEQTLKDMLPQKKGKWED